MLDVPTNYLVVKRAGSVAGTYRERLPLIALGMKSWGLHLHDVRAEYVSLVNRHMYAVPTTAVESWVYRGFKSSLASLQRELGRVPTAPLSDLIHGKSGRARRRMRDGVASYLRNGIAAPDARVSAMQKLEFYEIDKLESKENRTIQYRSTKYNAALGRFLEPIEQAVMRCTGNNPSGIPFMAKGRTQRQRATQILLMANGYSHPWFLGLDHSRFDAHVNKTLLKAEHSVYKKCHGYHPELVRLLSYQLSNVGKTKGGIRYVADGKRMSGDINTGLGNSILNYAFMRSWLDASGVNGDILLDGDDSIVVIEQADRDKLIDVKSYMYDLGMETEIESESDDITQIDFCQSRVCYDREGPFFCPNPRKYMTRTLLSPEALDQAGAVAVLRSSIMCLRAISRELPMVEPFERWLASNPGVAIIPDRLKWKLKHLGYDGEVKSRLNPSQDMRVSFARAWGIAPADQELYERGTSINVRLPRKERRIRAREAETLVEDLCGDDPLSFTQLYEPIGPNYSELNEQTKVRLSAVYKLDCSRY